MKRRAFLLAACMMPALCHAANPLVFVVHPYDTPSRIYARFRPLTLYLGGVLERPIKLVIASTYDEQIAMIAPGSPFTPRARSSGSRDVKLSKKTAVEELKTAENSGRLRDVRQTEGSPNG